MLDGTNAETAFRRHDEGRVNALVGPAQPDGIQKSIVVIEDNHRLLPWVEGRPPVKILMMNRHETWISDRYPPDSVA